MLKNLLLFIVIFLFSAGFTYSQEFDVREFKADPSDLAAIRFPRLSVNDEPCALIKVITNIPGMKFDSNLGIVDIVHQDEGYWIYVAPRERRLNLMADGFLPLDVPMPEPAAPNRVYSLIVAAKGLPGNLDVVPVNFIVDGHPDATLYIGEETYPIDQTVMIARGKVEIRIEKPGYRPVIDEIDVSETNTLFRYAMEGINDVVVTIRTNPAGASVYINNRRVADTTPIQEWLFPGTYSLRITMSEYNDVETQILVQEGQNNEFIFDMQKFVGTLALRVEPSDARITINQRNYTGQREIQFAPGTYRMVVEKEGYNLFEDRFVIEEGGRTERTVRLVAKTGSLRFTSRNPDARFKLMGPRGEVLNQWTGTTRIASLPIGNYRYEGELEGYAPLRGEVSITENQETRLETGFSEEQRLAFIREQERIANEQRRQQELLQAQKDKEQREASLRDEQARQQKQQKRKNMFAQDSYGTFNLSYTRVGLNTMNFQNNIASSGGIGIGMSGFFNFWALSYSGFFNRLVLTDPANSLFGVEDVIALSLSMTTGPAIRLFGFEFFAMAGFEGSIVSSEAFEYEELSVGDAILEYGAIFKPRNWSWGLRYCASMPLGLIDSYPPFSRQEFGIVFEF
jgi:hypothetical protein